MKQDLQLLQHRWPKHLGLRARYLVQKLPVLCGIASLALLPASAALSYKQHATSTPGNAYAVTTPSNLKWCDSMVLRMLVWTLTTDPAGRALLCSYAAPYLECCHKACQVGFDHILTIGDPHRGRALQNDLVWHLLLKHALGTGLIITDSDIPSQALATQGGSRWLLNKRVWRVKGWCGVKRVLVTFLQACVVSSVKMVLPPRSVIAMNAAKNIPHWGRSDHLG